MDIFKIDTELNSLVKIYYTQNQHEETLNKIFQSLNTLKEIVIANFEEIKNSSKYDNYLDIVFHWNTFLTFHGKSPLISSFPKAKGNFRTNRRKKIIGVVTSNKMQKTAIILVIRTYKHPLYKKTLKKSKKFKIHDPLNSCNVGDIVTAQECRKLSKDKYFRLVTLQKREMANLKEIA